MSVQLDQLELVHMLVQKAIGILGPITLGELSKIPISERIYNPANGGKTSCFTQFPANQVDS